MNFKEIQDLIKLVNKSSLTEFKMKNGDFEITIRTKKYGKGAKSNTVFQAPPAMISMPSAAPVAPVPLTPSIIEESPAENDYLEIRSPIVGTFYLSASPEKPPYKEVGNFVQTGDVVCIVEAMKLFNEIESEVTGNIVKVMVSNASPVEYDQVLFLVKPV